ncbi:MAG: hypothetical protein ACOH1I_02570 [Gallionellaceae bacterium]
MRSALILTMYLGDQLLSVMLPFSSGSFTIVLLAICMNRISVERSVLFGVLASSAAALCAGLVGATLSGTPITPFFIATVAVLACMWTVGASLRGRDSVLITERGAFVGVLASSAFLLLSVLGWDAMSLLQGAPTIRPSGLYFEPSHYALYVMPLWLIAFQHRQYRPWLYAALALAAGLCFSTTLAIFLMCALALRVYLNTARADYSFNRFGRQLIAGAVLAILVYYVSNLMFIDGVSVQAYVGSRLNGLVNLDDAAFYNVSSLVVLQGIELAQLSFSQSLGFGVGLGNFGTSPHILNLSAYRDLVNSIIMGSDLSLRDGGLLASKLVGELGILALAIPLLLAHYFRRLKAQTSSQLLYYHGAFAVALVCLMFARALPYFSAPACLAVFSLARLVSTRQIGFKKCAAR